MSLELNNKSISSKYDSDYFNEVLEMIKNNYQASDARFISEALKKEDEVIIDLPTDDSIKLLIKGNKVSIDNKELLVSILGNMFKNKKIIEKLEEDKYTDSLLKIRNRIAYDEMLNKKCLYNNTWHLLIFIYRSDVCIFVKWTNLFNRYSYNKLYYDELWGEKWIRY